MNVQPRVCVVIVNYNSGDLLGQCLTALMQQTRSPEQIIVVDNASDDSSLATVKQQFPQVHALRLPVNVGFAVANNRAIVSESESEWIALLNPDAIPKPDWLEKLVEAAVAHPEYAFFGSRLVQASTPEYLDGTGDVYHVSGLAWRRDYGRLGKALRQQSGEIFCPCAAAALYRRSALVAAGGFDESYFCFFEDVDLGFRLRLQGDRAWYVANAIVHHYGSAITGRDGKFSVYHGQRNLVWTYFKDMPWPLFWIYLPQHVLLNLAAILFYVGEGLGGAILRAKWDAMRGLPAIWRKRKAVQSNRRVGWRELRSVMAKGWLTPYFKRR